MSNLARKQYEQPGQSLGTKDLPVKKVQRHARISPGEKVLFMIFVLFVTFMAVKIVSVQASIYEVNKEIQDVRASVQEQAKINDDLSLQVADLSKYERVWKKAQELGLNLNENNVKVVEKR
ncbi:cell division protein FtsL [Siminovitchia sp. 179-K 8D1 HS]|uniref:cell division protein FtsL n=1 Tax=Siminovitchia sp. 179-K 8D1 HS TaxID=3142385 RepID=UPI0039A108B6